MLIAAAYDSETLCCLVPLSELQKIGWWLGGRHVTCRFAKIRAQLHSSSVSTISVDGCSKFQHWWTRSLPLERVCECNRRCPHLQCEMSTFFATA